MSLAANGVDLGAGVSLDELLAATLEVVEAEVGARVEGGAASGDDGDGDGGGGYGGRGRGGNVGDTLQMDGGGQ